jgi:cobalamin biosynthesis Mg chelatase CobN
MKRVTIFMTAAVLVLLAVFSLPATAQQPDTRDRTIMTFSNAVELPGMRLEAGTYVFRLADTPLRNVIQLLSSDEMNVLGQWLFVPAERQEVSGDTVVTFRETAAKTTPAVQFWYYPGEKLGKEFIYPKDQAMRIAQRTGVAVMSEDGPVTADAQVAASTTQSPSSVQAEAQAGTTGAVEGSGLPADNTRADAAVGTSGQDVRQEATVAQNTTPAQTDSYAQDNRGASNELPSTASPLVLSGLLGLLSLAGAMGLRAFRQ